MYYDRLSDIGIKLTRRSGQEKTLCPQCSDSRKNKRDKCLSVNIETGDYNCHNCGYKGTVRRDDRRKREIIAYEKPSKEYYKEKLESDKVKLWFSQRGISETTLNKFMIFNRQEFMPQTGAKENCICFPYFRDAEMVNIKFRDGRKNFKMVSKAELIFYNLNSIRDKRKVIICEGEIDCMSAYEAGFGQNVNPSHTKPDENGETKEIPDPLSEWGILSVPNGASKGNQKLDYLDNCSEWLLSLDEIVVATDNDEAGVMLRDELMRRLGVERCKFVLYPPNPIVTLKDGQKRPVKDFNEVLMYFGKQALVDCVFRSDSVPVEGVFCVEDVFETMLDNFRKGVQLAPATHFRSVDELFRWKKGEINLWSGYANHGKALCINTDIPTPNGFIKMGDIKVGDKVFDENGQQCNVTMVTDIMYNRPCYKVIFNDGTEIIADAEHLWFTKTAAARMSAHAKERRTNSSYKRKKKGANQEHKMIQPAVRTTVEILKTLKTQGGDFKKNNHSIDFCKPIQCEHKELLIHPYVLGAWLGDGTSHGGGIASNDTDVILEIEKHGFQCRKRQDKFMYGILGLSSKLKKLNLICNKHIPEDYLWASVEQRIDLLCGLMDTDGYIDKNGSCEFTTIKKELAVQFCQLVTSLGMKCSLLTGNATLNGRFISKKYRVNFRPLMSVFRLKRKLQRYNGRAKNTWRLIKDIIPIESVPVKCISVDSPNKLYLCSRSFIPTHNTTFAIQLMLTKSIWDGWKWAIFSPENFPANDFYDDLIEMYCGKWLNDISEEEYITAAAFINDHFFYVYPDGEHDLVSIHEKFRYLVMRKGVDGVLVDPFNQLDHTQKPYQREDQYLSQTLKDIKRFALLNAVSYNIIAHPKTPTYGENKQLPIVDMYDLYGGSMWGNKADQIIIYHRPKWHEDKSDGSVEIHVQKVKRKRTGGKQGSCELYMDWSKKRFREIPWDTYPCDPQLAAQQQELAKEYDDRFTAIEQIAANPPLSKPPLSFDEVEDYGDRPF